MEANYGKNNIKELFLSILPAQIFSYITSSLSGIVNGIIIGNFLTSLDMVALGFASPILQIITVCSTIVSAGARIICGKYIGRGQREKVNNTFTSSIYLLIGIGVLLTIGGLLLSKQIATIFASADAIEKTASYIRGLSIGIIPTILIPCLMVFLQMENETTYALVSTIVLAVLNLTLSLSAMKFIGIDIFGVGLVTSISQFLTLGFIIVRFFTVKHLPRLSKCETKLFNNILIIGLPSALSGLLYAFRNTILNTIATNVYGNPAVNALSILNSSCGPLDAINIGLGQAALMLTSIYIGEKDKDSLNTLSKIAIKTGILLALAKVLLIFLFSDNLALAYGADLEVLSLTVSLYKWYGICMPLNIITVVIMNTYQAFGKIRYCNILLLITALITPLSIAYFGGNAFGINAVWSCYALSEIIIIIIMYVIACIKRKHIITSLSEFLMPDNDLEIGNHLALTVQTIDEVINISKMIQEYCISEKVDKQRSMIAGLVCEEIAVNVIEHGFSKSKKKNKFIDIFTYVSNEKVYIRIKDNAISFNPHAKINESNDPTVNIGIKMVSKLAKEMYYQNTFGLNVLTIEL